MGWIRKSETYSPATAVLAADDDAVAEDDAADEVVTEEATEDDTADEVTADEAVADETDVADDAEATRVAVGGTAVAVGGTVVAVGGTAVAVGGTAVAVGGTAVALIASDDLDEAGTGGNGVGVGDEHATMNASTRPRASMRINFVFMKGISFLR